MHPCHTENPLEADVFIVPAQTVSGIWLSREKGPNGEPPIKDEGASYMREGQSYNLRSSPFYMREAIYWRTVERY